MADSKRARSWKRRTLPRIDLITMSLFSTLPIGHFYHQPQKPLCFAARSAGSGSNRYVRGWVNYFHLHNSTRVFVRQRFFLEQRMRKYLRGRRQIKGFGLRGWPASRLYKEFGLVAIPQYAQYRRTRMP